MRSKWSVAGLVVAGLVAGATTLRSQSVIGAGKPVLYVTATAHLDSQWNWTVQDTIRQYVPSTFYTNFKYFDQYPDYTFTYEGAIHYMWFKEYHPDDWATLQKYVANGRWRLAGSWIDAVDTNIPSPESLMRQALYGQHFFRQEFKKTSHDVYLPDCFGFGFALPSIANASGLDAFTTQKLTWGSSVPIPFPVGRWKGVDGSEVIANLNPGDYVTKITSDISIDPKWSNDVTPVGGDAKVGFRLFGTGDIGGGPDPNSIDWLEKSLHDPNGTVEIRNTSADQLSRDLTPAQKAALPVYEGELTMQTHGVGCYTSQAAMKKFNRQNELLADAAERAGVAARYLADLPYPTERLREAWTRVLWHQFHDDLTGTCIPQAYQFSWNDELSASNQFAGVLTSSTAAVANLLDTRGTGVPLVVYNPLSEARHDLVDATLTLPFDAPAVLAVTDAGTGAVTRAQPRVLGGDRRHVSIEFAADLPSVGYKIFQVTAAPNDTVKTSDVGTFAGISNARYEVLVDGNGDISSIKDRLVGRELLAAPIRLEMRDDPSPDKPAWRILFDTVNGPAREYVAKPRVSVDHNVLRPTIEVTREAAGSTIVQRISLPDGQDRVDVETIVDWKSPNTLLKVAFPLAASNPKATYDLGLGTIQRGNNTPKAYEVPAQQWADITDASGRFGTAVLNDSKYGWDKPADNILRLTLLHTPLPRATPYQGSNDLGHHRFVYSIVGHTGDWRDGKIPARAAELNQPLVAFQTTAHAGPLGRAFSFAQLGDTTGQFAIKAMKQAEDSDEIVVRVQERYGRPGRVQINMAAPITSARVINAAEEAMRPLTVASGAVTLDFTPYQPRTVAVRLAPRAAAPSTAAPRTSAPLSLPFDLDGISTDKAPADGDFDGKGHTLSGDLLPHQLNVDGVPFTFGSTAPGAKNVVVAAGQSVQVPAGAYDRVYVIAASVGADVRTGFTVGRDGRPVVIPEWAGAIGQWDSRLKAPGALREPFIPSRPNGTPTLAEVRDGMAITWDPQTFKVDPAEIANITPGFAKRTEIAWIGSHRHSPAGNQTYIQSYLFLLEISVPPGTRSISLPQDSRVRILAMTAATGPAKLQPAAPLYSADLPEPAPTAAARPAPAGGRRK